MVVGPSGMHSSPDDGARCAGRDDAVSGGDGTSPPDGGSNVAFAGTLTCGSGVLEPARSPGRPAPEWGRTAGAATTGPLLALGAGSVAGRFSGDKLTVTKDSMAATITPEIIATSGRSSIGCLRNAAMIVFAIVRTWSAASANAISRRGRLGPCPSLAARRAKVRAALRCVGVSPGSR